MPISAAERFQIAPTGRQQEAARLGNPLVLVVFFLEREMRQNYK